MNWNSEMEVEYTNSGMPYNSIGSFMDFFGGVAYDHLNFIFAAHSDSSYHHHHHHQESVYPSSNLYNNKYGSFSSYNDYGDSYVVSDELYNRPLLSNPSTDDHHHIPPAAAAAAASHLHRRGNSISASDSIPMEECPRHHQNNRDEVIWQDNIDPDNMTYEELLELGEAVGTQTRGLSEEHISLLPVSKFKRSLFSRKRSRHERCVICQMEYKRGDKRMTLPCKHLYHAGCCRRWLGINKACPICYSEVLIDASRR